MLIDIKKDFNGKIIQGSAHKKLESHLDNIIDVICKASNDNPNDKFNVRLGFTVFTVIEKNDMYIITSPNYIGNPKKEITPDLTPSLQILLEQTFLINKLAIKGESVFFNDVILIYDEFWKEEKIQMQKIPHNSNNSDLSGWIISKLGETKIDSTKMKKCYVFDLFKLRPALLKALVLPTNYKAVFIGNEIQAVFNDENVNILK